MKTFVARMKEPSTYAGLAAAALALGISVEDFTVWASGLAGIFAFLSILLGEEASK